MGVVESLKILLTADATSMEKEMKKAERSLKKIERDVRDVAQAFAFAGVAMAGFGTLMVREAAKFDRGVAGGVKRLSNAYSSLGIEIGRALMPVLEALTKALTKVVRVLESLSPQFKETAGIVLALTAAFAALVGTGTGMYAMFLKLAPVLLPIAGTLLMIVGVIAGVIAITTVLRAAWDNNWGGMRDTVLNAVAKLKEGFSNFWDFLKKGFKVAANMMIHLTLQPIRTILEGIIKLIDMLPANLKPEGMANTLGAIVDTLKAIQDGGIDGVFKDIGNSMDFIADKAEPIAQQVKKAFIDNLTDVKSFIAGMFDVPALAQKTSIDDQNKSKAKEWEEYKKRLEEEERERAGIEKKFTDAVEESERALRQEIDARREGIRAMEASMQAMRSSGVQGAVGAGILDATGFREKFDEKAKKEGAEAANAFGDDMMSTANNFAGRITGKLGLAGDVIDGAMEGFKMGGPFGAIIGAFVALIMESETMKKIIEQVNEGLKMIADLLGTLLSNVTPLNAAINEIIKVFVDILTPLFKMFSDGVTQIAPVLMMVATLLKGLAPVFKVIFGALSAISSAMMVFNNIALRLLFEVVKFITVNLLKFIQFLAPAWNGLMVGLAAVFNGMLDAFIALFGWIPGLTDAVNAVKVQASGVSIDMTALAQAIQEAEQMTWDEAMARAENIANMQDQDKKIKDVTESLTNVPAGYKVATARFNSMQARTSGNAGSSASMFGGSPFDSAASGSGSVEVITHVYVGTTEVAATVEKQINYSAFRRSGVPKGPMGRR